MTFTALPKMTVEGRAKKPGSFNSKHDVRVLHFFSTSRRIAVISRD
jgi:hypothetical protein